MCFFPEPSWKITKENEISLNPDGSRKAQSLNIIKGLQTLNKSLTQIERSRKAGVGTSFLARAWLLWGTFGFSVCLFIFQCCGWGSLAVLATLAFVFLSGFTPFNAPATLIASMCVSALCFSSCWLLWGPHAPFLALSMAETCAESPPALVLQEGSWLPLQSFISARPVFPTMRVPTALVGMSQSPRPLIFNRSKAHPLTRTLQLVNPGHASNSQASWTPARSSLSHPWGPGPEPGCSHPALMRLACPRRLQAGVWSGNQPWGGLCSCRTPFWQQRAKHAPVIQMALHLGGATF